jgi:hypothetical protein
LRYEVAVRTLCEFTAKRGDLDIRFTPSPSAIEGIAGHRVIASRRGPMFEKELTLTGEFGPLHVRGRADGYDPETNRLEEFKTYRGDLSRMPGNLIDDRFTQPGVRKLLPRWWSLGTDGPVLRYIGQRAFSGDLR